MPNDPIVTVASCLGLLALLLAAYLAGSLPSAWLLGKWMRGIDLRRHGSGNIGASNASRILGRGAGLIVLTVDAGKGAFAVLAIAPLLGLIPQPSLPWPPADQMRLACALMAMIGHAFPVWLGFRGGKAVATGAAAASCLAPWCALLCLGVFIAVIAVGRRVSLASMSAALALPAAYAVIYREPDFSALLLGFFILIAVLVLFLHRANIRRLLMNQEPPFRFKP